MVMAVMIIMVMVAIVMPVLHVVFAAVARAVTAPTAMVTRWPVSQHYILSARILRMLYAILVSGWLG